MKKKIMFLVLFVIFIIVIIFGGNIIRKFIIIEKIKDNLSNRSEYYYVKIETTKGSIVSNNGTVEKWKYSNDLEIRSNDKLTEIIDKDNLYLLLKEKNIYAKIDNINSEVNLSSVDKNSFLPEYYLSESSLKMALNYKIKTKMEEDKKCYEIKYKNEDITYIDAELYDLIKHQYITDNKVQLEEKYEWEKLDENSSKNIDELLDGFTEVTYDELKENM